MGGLGYAANTLTSSTTQHESPPIFSPDQIVVGFNPGTPAEAKRSAHAQAGGRVIHALEAIGAELVGIPRGTVLDKIGLYKRNPNVKYAEPNYYRILSEPPVEGVDNFVCSGKYWGEQWGLHNTGQRLIDPDTGECSTSGALDADIDWLEVWESNAHGRDTIKIAIVDTGIESTHPDLQSKIVETWVASQIAEGPTDLIGHGTHVAGIAAANTNNRVGIAGVGINSKVGSLKACQCYPDPIFCYTGICQDWDTAEAILHAKDQRYHVVNMSLGGTEVSSTVEAAVAQAFSAGMVLVSSAGNSYLHEALSYPAAYDGVIAVAATDWYDNLASFSNFGQWVEVAAPGVNILSTYPAAGCSNIADCYAWMSGTSMASPMVAGVAALVWAVIGHEDPITPNPTLRDQVINAILNNADKTGAVGQNMLAWTRHGRLNANRALASAGGTTPTNNPPSVSITSPANGAWFASGATIAFFGAATDTEDGSLSGSLVWTSNKDGEIGTGGSTSTKSLNGGTHTITASVTDSGGLSGSDSITITVSSITLYDVNPYKVRTTKYANLFWRSALAANVDVYRNGIMVVTTPNDGAYTDKPPKTATSATYKVCEAGTSACSNEVVVSW
jgi:thermitase